MTPIEKIVRAEIERSGPMALDRYMELCLSHPEHGYYMTRDPIGASGDFTTAPEISQMFGELIGSWLIQMWQTIGVPEKFNLVELGPGRGTLMSDILRVASNFPSFLNAASINLIEISPVLQAAQKETLARHDVSWIADLDALSDVPILLVANEFFDALPSKQFQKIGDVWLERVVNLDGGRLRFGLRKTKVDGFPLGLPDGAIVERSNALHSLSLMIDRRVEQQNGAALIIDYGDASGSGDTFQAVRGHEYVDVLENPGAVDLTVHVNFGDIARAAQNCASHLTTQGQFLKSLGIVERTAFLSEGKTLTEKQTIDEACRRLTAEDEMGTLFKAMAITQTDAPTPPGF